MGTLFYAKAYRVEVIMKTKNIVYCGVFIALAMLVGYVEQSFPLNIGIPGVKIGLANAVTIVALSFLGKKEAVLITILRIILSALLFGKLFAMIFSIAGAGLSLGTMLLLKKTDKFSNVGISISGGVMHNIGQIVAAAILLHTKAIIYYLPVLIIAGIVSGLIIGILSQIILTRINTYKSRSIE
jgi:heptaprenyl diphosphate synthase